MSLLVFLTCFIRIKQPWLYLPLIAEQKEGMWKYQKRSEVTAPFQFFTIVCSFLSGKTVRILSPWDVQNLGEFWVLWRKIILKTFASMWSPWLPSLFQELTMCLWADEMFINGRPLPGQWGRKALNSEEKSFVVRRNPGRVLPGSTVEGLGPLFKALPICEA